MARMIEADETWGKVRGKINGLADRAPALRIGVRRDENDIATIPTWKDFTGSDPDFLHAFAWPSTTKTWETIVEFTRNICALFKGYQLNWAVPIATPTQSLESFIAGDWDDHFDAMLEAILAHNPGRMIPIRPAWEPNGPAGWPWNASNGNHVAVKAATRRACQLIKAKSSRFIVEWCVSHHGYSATGPYDATDPNTGCYPGSDVVDRISPDIYLTAASISNNYTWSMHSQVCEPRQIHSAGYLYGLKFFADFARREGKDMSVPELGFGGDMPGAMREAAAFFKDPSNRVVEVGIWDKDAALITSGIHAGKYEFPTKLTEGSSQIDKPLSRAVFLEEFFGGPPTPREQARTSAYIARANPVVTPTWRALIDELFERLNKIGPWRYLDPLYVVAGPNGELARLGVNSPGSFTTHQPSDVTKLIMSTDAAQQPAFEAIAGSPLGAGVWRNDGGTAKVLRCSSLNPAIPLANQRFTKDRAHMALFALDGGSTGAQQWHAGNVRSAIGMNGGGRWVGRPNISTSQVIADLGQGAGYVMWNRTASNVWTGWFNGVQTAQGGVQPSEDLTSADFRLLGVPDLGAGTAHRIMAFHSGEDLPVTGQLNMPLRLNEVFSWYKNQIAP